MDRNKSQISFILTILLSPRAGHKIYTGIGSLFKVTLPAVVRIAELKTCLSARSKVGSILASMTDSASPYQRCIPSG